MFWERYDITDNIEKIEEKVAYMFGRKIQHNKLRLQKIIGCHIQREQGVYMSIPKYEVVELRENIKYKM